MKNNITFLGIYLLLISVLYSCDCHQNVSGIILDNQTKKPIENASIQKLNTFNKVLSLKTGQFNLYAISGGFVHCPPMEIIINKEGYFTDTVKIKNSKKKIIYLKEKKWIDNYCENELELIKPKKQLKIFENKLISEPDKFLEILEKELKGDFCYKTKKFGIQLEKFPIKVSVYKKCPEFMVHPFPTTSINLNNNKQALLNSNIIEFDSIPKYLENDYPETKIENIRKNNTITLYWNRQVKLENINTALKLIIKGYLLYSNKYSKKTYKRRICNLTKQELIELKKEIPFEIELGTITDNLLIIKQR